MFQTLRFLCHRLKASRSSFCVSFLSKTNFTSSSKLRFLARGRGRRQQWQDWRYGRGWWKSCRFSISKWPVVPLLAVSWSSVRVVDTDNQDNGSVLVTDKSGRLDVPDQDFLQVFAPDKSGPPKTVLVLDGGGCRGCMSIQILKKLEQELKALDPDLELWQVFDLVVGTSTGGLISLGLCKEKMNCDEIDGFYDRVADKVFKDAESTLTQLKFAKSALWPTKGALDTKKLEEVMQNTLGKTKPLHDPTIAPGEETKCAVIATLINNMHLPVGLLLRTYDVKEELLKHSPDAIDSSYRPDEGYLEISSRVNYLLSGVSGCKAWEAARATSAAPTYFDELELSMPPKFVVELMKRNICETVDIGYIPSQSKTWGFPEIALDKDLLQQLDDIAEHVYQMKYMVHKDYDKISEWNPTWLIRGDPREKDMKEIVSKINKNIVDEVRKRADDESKGRKVDLETFKEEVYDFEYTLRLQDGGMNSNSPLLFAYVEASRMWPDSDINMISVGTGTTPWKDIPKLRRSSISFSNLFGYVFGAKELSALSQMVSYAAGKDVGFNLTRLNPEIDPKKSDMGKVSLMPYWRKKGKDLAQDKEQLIRVWAQFLHYNYKRKKINAL